jgi:hypothetical protein
MAPNNNGNAIDVSDNDDDDVTPMDAVRQLVVEKPHCKYSATTRKVSNDPISAYSAKVVRCEPRTHEKTTEDPEGQGKEETQKA